MTVIDLVNLDLILVVFHGKVNSSSSFFEGCSFRQFIVLKCAVLGMGQKE